MKGISKLCPFLSASFSGSNSREWKGRGLKGEATWVDQSWQMLMEPPPWFLSAGFSCPLVSTSPSWHSDSRCKRQQPCFSQDTQFPAWWVVQAKGTGFEVRMNSVGILVCCPGKFLLPFFCK